MVHENKTSCLMDHAEMKHGGMHYRPRNLPRGNHAHLTTSGSPLATFMRVSADLDVSLASRYKID